MDRLVAARADDRTVRAYWTMSRTDSDRAFHAARRHSRRIRSLRILVPGLAVLCLAGFAFWSWLDPFATLPNPLAKVTVTGSKITMEAPRLTGFTRDARPYELIAKSASQDINRPDVLELQFIQAKMKMPQDATAEMTALDGLYDSKKEILTLGKDVVLISSSGYKVWLTDAVVDIRKSHLVTDKPVRVEMLQGKLDAKRLEVSESGALLSFDGGVQMVVRLGDGARPAAAPREATPVVRREAPPR